MISGGENNEIDAYHCAIPGGLNNSVTNYAQYTMVFGFNVAARTKHRVMFFDEGGDTTWGALGVNRDDDNGGVNFPIHVGTNTTNGNGAHLTTGGVWTNGSSKEVKEKFQKLNGEEVLARISSLPVDAWEYKGTGERHIGPCAEDFHEAFDVGVIKEDGTRETKYLAAWDVAGVSLAGVKELIHQNQELRWVVEQMEKRIADLEAK